MVLIQPESQTGTGIGIIPHQSKLHVNGPTVIQHSDVSSGSRVESSVTGNGGKGIQLLSQYSSDSNAGGRIFFQEDGACKYGISLGYNGGSKMHFALGLQIHSVYHVIIIARMVN